MVAFVHSICGTLLWSPYVDLVPCGYNVADGFRKTINISVNVTFNLSSHSKVGVSEAANYMP
jgi:hypothetical protein